LFNSFNETRESFEVREIQLTKKKKKRKERGKKKREKKKKRVYFLIFWSPSDVGDGLLGTAECLDHLAALGTALRDLFAFLHHLLERAGLVELAKQLALDVVACMADQVQHDRLGDEIGNGSLDNVEVRVEQELCMP